MKVHPEVKVPLQHGSHAINHCKTNLPFQLTKAFEKKILMHQYESAAQGRLLKSSTKPEKTGKMENAQYLHFISNMLKKTINIRFI